MKIGFLSDIHGNIEALKAVMHDIKKNQVSKVYCLGDYLGYYFKPNECLNLLNKKNCKMIKGNHEEYYLRIKANKNLLKKYENKNGKGITVALRTISVKNYKILQTLKRKISFSIKENNKNFLLFHATPKSLIEKIYPDTKKKYLKKFISKKYDYYIFGHSHRRTQIEIKNKKFLNPGSVGQPRDENKGANWLLYDANLDKFIFKNTKYSIDSILDDINKFDLDRYSKLAKYL
tara:strand:+ start:1401 stop:2099 length:699 start_codon:yes stop_codon:yes gene_type:complete